MRLVFEFWSIQARSTVVVGNFETVCNKALHQYNTMLFTLYCIDVNVFISQNNGYRNKQYKRQDITCGFIDIAGNLLKVTSE